MCDVGVELERIFIGADDAATFAITKGTFAPVSEVTPVTDGKVPTTLLNTLPDGVWATKS